MIRIKFLAFGGPQGDFIASRVWFDGNIVKWTLRDGRIGEWRMDKGEVVELEPIQPR